MVRLLPVRPDQVGLIVEVGVDGGLVLVSMLGMSAVGLLETKHKISPRRYLRTTCCLRMICFVVAEDGTAGLLEEH